MQQAGAGSAADQYCVFEMTFCVNDSVSPSSKMKSNFDGVTESFFLGDVTPAALRPWFEAISRL